MAQADEQRKYDVVVFGATGFTGKLAAEYLARTRGTEPARWAIAGRNEAKLAEVKRALVAIDPACKAVGVLRASADDPASLRGMASETRVVLTTVGPYAQHGEPLVAACVDSGTDYVDITGEPEFVDGMIARYDAAARARGVRVVNCCGFDSVPHDLGVQFAVGELGECERCEAEGFVWSRGTFSGGTWHSAINAFANARAYAARRRQAGRAERAGDGRDVRGLKPSVRYERALHAWVCPLPTIDPQVVLRSARALPEYGRTFRYGHYAQVRSGATLAAGAVGVAGLVALSQFGPTRELLLKVRAPGEGPSAEQRARSKFRVTVRARGDGREVTVAVSGGDPGYDETAKMISESALCLALDRAKLPDRAGVLTTAAAMGPLLRERLVRAGMRFEVLARG